MYLLLVLLPIALCSMEKLLEAVERGEHAPKLNDHAKRAMLAIDRADFAPENPYADQPVSIGHDQTISAPHMHAFALEFAQDALTPGASVLDVGSGSGYLTAVMAKMVQPKGKVVGVELVTEICEQSRQNIRKHHGDLPIEIICGSAMNMDFKEHFDVIHVGDGANRGS